MNRRSKKRRRDRASHPSKRGPFLAPHPLQGLDSATRAEFVAAVAVQSASVYQENLARLVELSGSVSALHVLAVVSCYSLMTTVGKAAEADRLSHADKPQQAHVEFLQALFLRHKWESREGSAPEVIQQVFDALPALFEAYGHMQAPSGAGAQARETAAAEAVRAYLRGHTAVVRNWGYFSAVKRIASEVLRGIDTEFASAYGLKATDLLRLFEHLVREMERKMNEHNERVHSVFKAANVRLMADELLAQFANIRGIETLRKELLTPGVTAEQAQYHAFTALEHILPSYFFIGPDDLAQDLGLPEEALAKVLKRLSISFGELSSQDPSTLFLSNPVWLRPLLEMSEDVYFCVLPQTLMSFVLPIIEELIKTHPAVRDKLQRVRSEYLESSTERLFRQAFPGCEVARGYKWREDGQRFESDLVVRYDATIILVESKSGRVSWPALRGAQDRIVKHIEELIVAPSDQSARLAQRLQQTIAGSATGLTDFPLPLFEVRAICRLSVTLHDFATVQSFPALILEAGLVQSQHRLAPCVTIADLEVIFDILDTPYLRLHYLRRRAELVGAAYVFGDELDALGLYLDTGFNLGGAEIGKIQLLMSGYSARIDRYYVSMDEGVVTKKPRANITSWVRLLCDQLMTRNHTGWYEMAHALLCMPHDVQVQVEREVRSRAKRMSQGKLAKAGQDSIVVVPADHRRVALVFHIRAAGDRRPARDTDGNLARQAFESDHVELCVVFTFAADTSELSYRSASLLYRSDRPVEARTYL